MKQASVIYGEAIDESEIEKMMRLERPLKCYLEWCHDRIDIYERERVYNREEPAKHKRIADRCESQVSGLRLARDQERSRASTAEMHQKLAEDRARGYQKLVDVEIKKTREAEQSRDKELIRVEHLGRRIKKLEKDLREARSHSANSKLTSAIHKIAQSPVAAKRLAAACHPDKVPSELCDVATELFRFVQGMRDRVESVEKQE